MLVIKEARSVGPVETMHAHQCVSPALLVTKRSSVAPQRTRRVARGLCSIVASLSQRNAVTAQPKQAPSTRDTLRLAIPSKGRMAEDTQQLLKDCQLSVYKPNPRQYTAQIPLMPQLEVWFQRASDVVRKLSYGDFDLGIVGLDMFAELSHDDPDLVVVHNALDFGHCHLGLGVPMGGKFANINSLDQLKGMPEWSESNPMRVVTGYQNVARKFFQEKGFEHVVLLSADGALEAAPLMGSADIILDLISTGVTLRENNLKELSGGLIMESQGALVANKRALQDREGLLEVVHELIERFEAHLKAGKFFQIQANMRGDSADEVAQRLMSQPGLSGLDGPTISPMYTSNATQNGSAGKSGFYDCLICVPKKQIYSAVKEIRKLHACCDDNPRQLDREASKQSIGMFSQLGKSAPRDGQTALTATRADMFAGAQIGGSGVVVNPITYIFDEEPARWRSLLDSLQIEK